VLILTGAAAAAIRNLSLQSELPRTVGCASRLVRGPLTCHHGRHGAPESSEEVMEIEANDIVARL
jgi:hypothetical protein